MSWYSAKIVIEVDDESIGDSNALSDYLDKVISCGDGAFADIISIVKIEEEMS